ncbi:MAG: hypothetical protein WBX27_07620 [Specibacter sp.]
MTPDKLTPHPTLQPARRRMRMAAASIVLAATLAVSGCSMLPSGNSGADAETGSTTEATSASTAGASKTSAKPAQPPTAGELMAEKVKASLNKLGSNSSSPNREQMLAAMVEAGAVKDKVEVSIDRTPTGLAVDAIEAAAPVAKECVVGQVRDGKAAVTILPLLASGLCFVGNQH